MQKIHKLLLAIVLCTTATPFVTPASIAVAAETKKEQDPITLEEKQKKEEAELREKKQEKKKLELENDFIRLQSEHELASLRTEIERLRLEIERLRLEADLRELQSASNESLHKEKIAELTREKDLLVAEFSKRLEQYQLETIPNNLTLQNVKIQGELVKAKEALYKAEIAEATAYQERIKYSTKAPVYLKDPFCKKTQKLILSDRCIPLNGVITPWRANYIADMIQFFNNQDGSLPIFIIIGNSPGGSADACLHILKAMQGSSAPVYVVVKSFAASAAAIITTLAQKSYAYPGAEILHHQVQRAYYWIQMSAREHSEETEYLKKAWERIAGPIAKKMGISLRELDKRLYEKSARGEWMEFADEAQKLKWVDHIIQGIEDTAVQTMPDPENYTYRRYRKEYYFYSQSESKEEDRVIYLPPLAPGDFYYLYNPDQRYQIAPGKLEKEKK